ncbi:hypothetical protein F4824DRAFT_481398 [Ustulina deusta]|nr:hypothetical protein F4824DRAFT_481398 [Ustulina deusta]
MSREREKDEYTRPRRPDGREATADFARGGTRSKADRDRGSDGIIVSRSAPSRHKYISPGYSSQFARLDDFNRHQDRHTAEESMRRRFSQKGSLVSQSSPVNNIKSTDPTPASTTPSPKPWRLGDSYSVSPALLSSAPPEIPSSKSYKPTPPTQIQGGRSETSHPFTLASSKQTIKANDQYDIRGYRPKGDPQWFEFSMAKHKRLKHSINPPTLPRPVLPLHSRQLESTFTPSPSFTLTPEDAKAESYMNGSAGFRDPPHNLPFYNITIISAHIQQICSKFILSYYNL